MKAYLLQMLAAAAVATAQLSGRVGPLTSRDAKAAKKVCNILSYGGVASATTDNSDAISKAWADCKAGGQLLIPSGSYGVEKSVSLADGQGVSINLEGVLVRLSGATAGGNLIAVQSTTDFELFSGNSKGAIQGYGYELHKDGKTGPNLITITNVSNFSIHGLALVDAPARHLTLDTCSSGEVYNLIIRGAAKAGSDGIDLSGTNIWVHDVEVSNKAECVNVQTPSKNILVESVFCNLSGGCSIGPLDAEWSDVKYVTYQNVYSQRSDHMLFIKANGGIGYFTDSKFQNFTGHGNEYTLNLDAHSPLVKEVAGEGIVFDRLEFTDWSGTCVDGTAKPPIRLHCPRETPCGALLVEDFNVWTETGASQVYECESAFGLGACMNQFAGNGRYTSRVTVATMDPAKYQPTPMPGELTAGLGITTSIDIPAVPTTFYPGLKPTSSLLSK